MTEFVSHTRDSAPESSRARLAQVEATWGFVPKLHGNLAESPIALEAYDTLFGLVGASTLSPVEQQVAFQTVNVFHGCEYCTAGHTFLSRKAGMSEQAVQALRNGTPIAEDRLEALHTFTRALVRERGLVGDAAVEAFLAAGFTRAQALEVIVIVATKTISNYVNHVTHTPKESFMSDPSLAWRAPRASDSGVR